MESNDSPFQEPKEFWKYLEENRKEVSGWPTWMRGEAITCSTLEFKKSEQQPRLDEEESEQTAAQPLRAKNVRD